ncbi:MAG: TetR/AcrR family transcriptional regulator [Bacteroidales bacterium]|nr:TetR/AcrR family transcriptional regulator [Bacteroidales bacterium]MCF6341817.1 TetR/AcrR family transcriptional regulator [Bacteroidales bacterium]
MNKREEIAGKVCELYREYGIKSVTMDDVARQLSISKKTLYEYFRDKKDLVVGVMESIARNKAIDLSIPRKENVNAIEELFYYYKMQVQMIRDHKPAFIYDLKKYYPDLYRQFQEVKRARILDSVQTNLIKGKKEGLYRDDLDESVIARLNLMRIEGIMNSGTFSFKEVVSTDFFSGIFRYHVYGIVSDEGRRIFEKELNKLNIL